MTLVDTSVWVEHFRKGNAALTALLNRGEALTHPFIVGELACGTLTNRSTILGLLEELPAAVVAENDEVVRLVERNALYGRGLGWIDVHLLASAMLSRAALMTFDEPLEKVARGLTMPRA